MLAVDPGEGGGAAILPVAPPPPAVPPAGGGGGGAGEPRNSNGETLGQAEAAVLAEVAAGALGSDALARHPLPAGTSTAEALRFLASLPQTVYQLGQPGGTVVGPPVDTLPPPPPPPPPPPVPRNANGETLQQAEAAVLQLVAGGMDASDAFALHPLPDGTPESEVIRFLNSLAAVAPVQPPSGGTVGFQPGGGGSASAGDSGDSRDLESAYKAPGVAAQWRNIIDVFMLKVPSQRAAVNSLFDSPKELFR